jgi:hypothetical protein
MIHAVPKLMRQRLKNAMLSDFKRMLGQPNHTGVTELLRHTISSDFIAELQVTSSHIDLDLHIRDYVTIGVDCATFRRKPTRNAKAHK